MKTAERLLKENEPTIALVVAHMACEIYTEQVMSVAFYGFPERRGGPPLEDAIVDLLPSRSLANVRVRKVYTAITSDEIHKHDPVLWQKFVESAGLRNGAIHRGEKVSLAEAQEACEAVQFVLQRLEKTMNGLEL